MPWTQRTVLGESAFATFKGFYEHCFVKHDLEDGKWMFYYFGMEDLAVVWRQTVVMWTVPHHVPAIPRRSVQQRLYVWPMLPSMELMW